MKESGLQTELLSPSPGVAHRGDAMVMQGQIGSRSAGEQTLNQFLEVSIFHLALAVTRVTLV